MNPTAFVFYWSVALCVLCPIAWLAIASDLRHWVWTAVVTRLLIGLVLAAAMGSVLYAAEVRNTIPEICATLSGWEWWFWCVL